MKSVALCILTWNEYEGCKNDIPQIDMTKFEQIYCLDGGSTDGTVEYLENRGINCYQQKKKGLNLACKEAVALCTCDAVVFFHPKGSVRIEDIYKFRKYFEEGYELIIASRMLKESHNEEDGKIIKLRKWFVLALAFLAKCLFKKEGNTCWDVLHGFRGVTIEAFKKMEISDMNPSIDIEMVCRSYALGMKRIEFPTYEKERVAGNTHFKAFPTGKKLLKYIFWEASGKRGIKN